MFALLRTVFGVVLGGLIARLMAVVSRFHTGGQRPTIARRSFLRNAALGAALIILAEIGAGFVRFFWPNKTGAFGKELTVAAADVPAVDGSPFTDTAGKFYLVHTKDGIMALYWKCPHLGCTVPWVGSENQFHCPCHGSIYAYDGNRLGGPAPRPMDTFPVRVTSTGDVLVDTGKPTTRGSYDPSQAVAYP